MKFLKFVVCVLTIFTLLIFSYGYLNEHEVILTLKNIYGKNPTVLENNIYMEPNKNVNVEFATFTDNFIANSKDDLINIYYTIIASGMDEFTFYCDNKYEECISDVLSINNDNTLLSQMNNFVSVYNTFKSVKTTYTTKGKITLYIDRIYNSNNIEIVNNILDKLYNEISIKDGTIEDNIKAFHDYIINNTKYNLEDKNNNNFTPSSTAIGVFVNHLATCNGYTDAMSLLLDKMGVLNIRISNNKHIWNLVYLNNEWLHLDLTWDDPVNDEDKDLLLYDYYLKNTSELNIIATDETKSEHLFNKNIYNFVN